ncbi:MAG: hypothetical protein NC087_05260 [Anaeroplasma bactoclasticum]|nr:hypothetical protein [Anaeroplasma bactoclasticum]
MPNWMQSKLTITGKDAEKVMKSLIEPDKTEYCGYRFVFNKIKPMPKSLMIQSGTTTDKCVSYYITKLSDIEYAEMINKALFINANWARSLKKIDLSELEETKNDLIKHNSTTTCDEDPLLKTEQDILNYGKRAVDNVLEYGYQDWYDWRIHNWNTKWDACNTNYYPDEDPTTIYFQTAWSDVRNLIRELSRQHPQNTFQYSFAEEQMGYYCGFAHYKNGKTLQNFEYDDYSKEAYEQSFALWGEDENYVYSEETGTYEYIDEDDDMGNSEGEM